MTQLVDDYLAELEAALRVRGPARRRFLAECREHLLDASALHGPQEAVRRFGDPTEVAHGYDVEVATRRSMRATAGSVVGAAAVAGSTLALVNAADPQADAVLVWAILFFAFAQTSAVCAVLAVLQATAMRHTAAHSADLALLHRRNLATPAFALLTMLAAGGVVPGHASPWLLLPGPVIAVVALAQVMHARHLARAVGGAAGRVVRSPIGDLLTAVGWGGEHGGVSNLEGVRLLLPAVPVAAAAAFAWSMRDHGGPGASAVDAGIEVLLLIAGFVVLGRGLGLRRGAFQGMR